MIRSPVALRLVNDPHSSPRDAWRAAAALGVRGLVLDASGLLAPHRLGETARRDVRQYLRTLEISLVALHLPARRPFDTIDQLDDRLARADSAFELAFALGASLVLLRAGAIPPVEDADRRAVFMQAVTELGRRADRRGVRLALEIGNNPAEAVSGLLQELALPSLAASFDPALYLASGWNPVAAVVALGKWLAHTYATDGATLSRRPQPGVSHALGYGFAPGTLDWESYLGSLEEVDYRGYLTIWPDPRGDLVADTRRVLEILRRF